MNRVMIGVAKIGLLAFLAPALFSPALAQEKSGVAAAVNPNAVSTPPGQITRTLLVGSDVIFRERIATQADGQVQLIFLDESSLTVGPGSDVTIDEFVYDPKAKTGKMSVRMTGGLVRFVGGRISKSGDVSITTPVSVIGIRGGMGYVEATETSSTATNLFGTLSVKGATGGEQVVSRPGFAVTTQLGQTPATPVRVDPAQLVRLSRSLEAPPQAAARNASGAIEGKLDSSQVSEKNSGQAPDSISPEASAQRADASKNPSSTDSGLVRQAVQQNVTSTIQNSVISSAGGLSGELIIGSTATQVRASDGALVPFKLFPATFTNGRIDQTSNIARFTLSDGSIVALQLPARGTRSVTDFGVGSTTSYQAPDGRYFFVNTSVAAGGVTNQVVYTGGQAVRTGNYTTAGSIIRTYDFVSDTSAALKFTGGIVGTYANKVETPYVLRTQPSGNFSSGGTARTVGLYAGLGIDGQGVTQRSGIMVGTGTVFQADASFGGNPVNVNIIRGSFNDGSSPISSRLNTSAATPLDGRLNAFYGVNRPDYFTLTDLDYSPAGVPTPATSRLQSPGPSGNVNTPVQFAYAMAPSTTDPSNAAINSDARTARTMNGYVGGVVGLSSTSANALQIKTQNFDPANVSLTTDPATNRLVAQFKFDTLPTATGNTNSGGATFNPDASRSIFGEFIRFEYNFGSITGSHRSRSAFINDSVYAATEQRPTADATTGSFYGNGNQTNQNPTLGPVGQLSNDPAVAGRSVADRTNSPDLLYLASSGTVPITGLLPSGTALCECNFLSWGWWGGVVGVDDPARVQRLIRLHLANYVVGVLPSIGQIPTTGSATYVGNAIGTVKNGALNYVAAGGFQKNWDFASRSGTITVSNFDGGNYTARSSPVANPGNFAYSGTGTRGAITVNGSFFASPTDPVKGVGGQFLINQTGNSYRASGIVIGQR
jgi:hypothetical protein